ncbi:DUF418 domain-containing protein [Propionibacterium australiense]|nr:DUF418 domain-containing protein [Propionibacterium australiense]RLP06467.1 DUF418 domain-containing protein [Propionibacterium australiense]RLP11588.1 DUF418 domain-containing protein [Propionibacterium australiense]
MNSDNAQQPNVPVTVPEHRSADGGALAATAAPAPRYQVLDVLRGFAVCGILLVNTGDITNLGMDLPVVMGRGFSTTQNVLFYLVSTRFVPIFSFMFGMSLMFVADSARRRGARPWRVLLRRMLGLLVIGLLHSLIYPGEVLKTYAVVGMVLIPVVLSAPRRVVAALGVVATVASFAVAGSSVLNVPGLFLLGAMAVAYGLPTFLEHPDRRLVIAAGALAVLTGLAVFWQFRSGDGDPRFVSAGGIAGGVQAALYVVLVALACATPLRRPLAAFLEPLGRTALSCYVGASCIVVPVGLLLGWRESEDLLPVLGVAAVVLVIQSVIARLWLRHFRYGPLEWIWRCLTWWKPQPMRRDTNRDTVRSPA